MNRSTYITLAAALMFGAGAAQAASPQRIPACSWNSPGQNPFMGEVVAAVDHYPDIPADVRQRLKQRMAERRYDDIVTIRRDSIVGRDEYDPGIRDMHFGERSVCAQTTRAGWSAEMRERGLVYCEAGHCILVPTVCRNVSRIDRLPPKRVAEPAVPAGPGDGELMFDPPAAGPSIPIRSPSGRRRRPSAWAKARRRWPGRDRRCPARCRPTAHSATAWQVASCRHLRSAAAGRSAGCRRSWCRLPTAPAPPARCHDRATAHAGSGARYLGADARRAGAGARASRQCDGALLARRLPR